MYNALYIDSMENNLVPPFVIRRRGNEVNDVPKIQCNNPTDEDHALIFEGSKVKIPLQLQGIVSYFDSRKPTVDEVVEAVQEDTILEINIQEDVWDPHNEIYARQEAAMLNFEGNIVEAKVRDRMLVNDLSDDNEIQTAFSVELGSVSNTLNSDQLADALKEKDEVDDFMTVSGVNISDEKLPAAGESLDGLFVSATHMGKQSKGISPEELSKIFHIDLSRAKQTLDVTTQRLRRSNDPTLARRFNTNDKMLRYRRVKEFFYTDTFFATGKAGTTTRGHTCMQMFVTDKGFVHVVPMVDKTGSSVAQAMKEFFKIVGVPDAIICDKSKEQTEGEAAKLCRQVGTQVRILEPNTPWANRAELYIGIFKSAIRKELYRTDCPIVLWDYCAEHRAMVNNATASRLAQLHGRTPHETVYGEEADISNVCQYQFYDWGMYRESNAKFPYPSELLCRVLTPSRSVGNAMCQYILRVDGKVLPRSTVRTLTTDELNSTTHGCRRQAFDLAIKRKLGDSLSPPPPATKHPDEWVPYEDNEDTYFQQPETDNMQYDDLINAEVILPHRDKNLHATVIGRTKDSEGNEKGRYHSNPILNTQIYDVMFPDGAVKQYSANIIAENMWAQVDHEGHQYRILEAVTGHRKNGNAVEKGDQYVYSKQGKRKQRQTTSGWDMCILWRDGSEEWIPLKEIKESNPLEVAEYVKANQLEDEPAFKWWVPYVLRKRKRIIAAVKQRVKRNTHKYGIKVPLTVEEAYQIDKENNNTLWRDAIAKEIRNVSVAFEIMENDENLPPGFSLATCHMVFDVKMDFTRKARYVLDGHKTSDPKGSTYAGVVSRESVRIAFTYAALNGIDVMAADILNAYLQAPSSEKHYIVCGLEFGLEHMGKRARIVRALYGGKTSGRDFRNSLRSCMNHLGFVSCKADPDIWMREATKSDGTKYWEYVLLYVDDALVVSERGEHILREEVGKYFELKEASIGPPDIYLGGKVSKVKLENGVSAYSFSASQYVQAAVNNVEAYLADRNLKLPCRASTPLSMNYRPEVDITDELEPADAAHYQSLIGILRWMVELGRIDITCEVSMMSSHLALPRMGHLNQLYHMFAYLKKNHNSELVFDPSDKEIDMSLFPERDWSASEFGQVHTEKLPANAPEARGLGFTMLAYVDADHATDSVTRRSRTGFLVYLNNAPIYWLSKKQNSVETSSFGSEFCAMKQCTEYIRGLRYKLRMMGIPCDEPTWIFGDNQSVLWNTTCPDSVLKKKSNSIAYHFVREGCARSEWRTAYINTHKNVADLLTKPLPAGEKRMSFVRMILHHL